MRPYRPMRALVGALMVVASVVAAIAIYSRVGDRTEYLELTRSVLAGEQIADADLRVASVSSDDEINAIVATARSTVVGQYARYRLRLGSFVGAEDIQPNPIVTPGSAVMSVAIVASEIPPGLREQSRVALIVSPAREGGDRPPPVRVEATITAVPANILEMRTAAEASRATVTIGIEIPPESMDVIAEAESISLALIELASPFPATQATAPADAPGQSADVQAPPVDTTDRLGAAALPAMPSNEGASTSAPGADGRADG